MEIFQKVDQKRILIGIGLLASLYVIFNMQEWSRIPAGLLIGAGLIFLAWKYFKNGDKPKKLIYLVMAAFLFRFALGALWAWALPEFGYDNPVNNAGYVMEDAFNRDQVAWTFAQSDELLLSAYSDYSHTDQYGGLLFISAGIYRYLGGITHQPLMLVAIFGAVSALAVMFVWLIADNLWNRKTANLAAWFMVLYPEVCLLGSSQMREALIPTLILVVIYLTFWIRDKFSWAKIVALGLTIMIGLLISIPFGGIALSFSLVLFAFPYYQNWIKGRNRWAAGIITGVIFLGSMVAAWLYVSEVYGVWYQQYLSLYGSGMLTYVLEQVPEYLHSSIITIYGIFRPLLPAALTNLVLLATIKMIQEKKLLHVAGIFTIINWVWIIFSSYRSGGDMWDNPRYRVYLSGIQILLAAWLAAGLKGKRSPWVRRGGIAVLLTVIMFMLWYISRKLYDFGWAFMDLWDHTLLTLSLAGLYIIGDLVVSNYISSRKTKD
jgi:hypothetical protein